MIEKGAESRQLAEVKLAIPYRCALVGDRSGKLEQEITAEEVSALSGVPFDDIEKQCVHDVSITVIGCKTVFPIARDPANVVVTAPTFLLLIGRLVCFAELAHDPVFDPLAAPPIDRRDSGAVQEHREVQVIATR